MTYGKVVLYTSVRIFLFLFAVWVLFSSQVSWSFLAIGLLSSIAMTALLFRMDLMDSEILPVQLNWGLVTYLALLMIEIVRSNFFVARLILNPWARVRSKLVLVPLKPGKSVSKVLFANSVTLTPGTITIVEDVHSSSEDDAFIHVLDDGASDAETNLKDFQDRIRGIL